MGKISRIQLRGISRTPSDRMSEDGGLSESLNMYLDTAESAPAFVPEDVTEKLGLPEDLQAERIFIHKTANYENYIVVFRSEVVAYAPETEGDTPQKILELSEGETVNDISSVGNTLIILTSKRSFYVLYKELKYVALGDTVYFPQYTIKPLIQSGSEEIGSKIPDYFNFKLGNWGPQESSMTGLEEQTMAKIWEGIERLIDNYNMRLPGVVIFCYAINLYNERRVYSNPIMFNIQDYVDVTITSTVESLDNNGIPNRWDRSGDLILKYINRFDLIADDQFLQKIEDWKDIIYSIEVYAVPCLNYMNREYAYCERIYSHPSTKPPIGTVDERNSIYPSNATSQLDAFCEALVNLRKVADFPVTDKYLRLNEVFTSANGSIYNTYIPEDLSSQPLVEDLEFGQEKLIANKSFVYNQSIAFAGVTSELDLFPDTQPQIVQNAPGAAYYNKHDIYCLIDGGEVIYKQEINGLLPAFLFFPDSRCKEFIVKSYWEDRNGNLFEDSTHETRYGKFEAVAHYSLKCAVFSGGFNLKLRDITTETTDLTEGLREQRKYDVGGNKIFFSDIQSPFTFPDERKFTFQSRVLGLAIATTALSQGQFGQFPLYVFTEDGIWTLETAVDGSFISQKPLSREICVNPDSICSIDNAVVFVTSKAVMMIQGSQVMNISPYMNGKHYMPNDSALNLIRNQEGFDTLIEPISDDDPFMSFMKDAKVAYDYTGQRLIFISPTNKGFQYVYKIDTQTWHKVAFEGLNLLSPLNSYPECLVMTESDTNSTTKIVSLSTVLDAKNPQKVAKGILITRPFDLGEPDVFKTITDVRIRGQFPKGAVKFILQASNDWVNWVTISTLRGRSWKLFRIFVLADLEPTDRISWIDVQYETKFTNKLR